MPRRVTALLGTLIADVPFHAFPDSHATHASRRGGSSLPPPRAGDAGEDKAYGRGARVLRTAAGILSGNYPCFAPPGALAEHLRRLARAFRWLGTHHAQNAPNCKPQRSSIP